MDTEEAHRGVIIEGEVAIEDVDGVEVVDEVEEGEEALELERSEPES